MTSNCLLLLIAKIPQVSKLIQIVQILQNFKCSNGSDRSI